MFADLLKEIPRNEVDWYGGVYLLDPVTKMFYRVGFDNGMNCDDLGDDCDDALYLEAGYLYLDGVSDELGGLLVFNRKRSGYKGDIRNALVHGLEMLDVDAEQMDRLIYVASFK